MASLGLAARYATRSAQISVAALKAISSAFFRCWFGLEQRGVQSSLSCGEVEIQSALYRSWWVYWRPSVCWQGLGFVDWDVKYYLLDWVCYLRNLWKFVSYDVGWRARTTTIASPLLSLLNCKFTKTITLLQLFSFSCA
jgi:hypothetical protein